MPPQVLLESQLIDAEPEIDLWPPEFLKCDALFKYWLLTSKRDFEPVVICWPASRAAPFVWWQQCCWFTCCLAAVRHGSFWRKNSLSSCQPPPTRTIMCLRRILTNIMSLSPTLYFPSPIRTIGNCVGQVHWHSNWTTCCASRKQVIVRVRKRVVREWQRRREKEPFVNNRTLICLNYYCAGNCVHCIQFWPVQKNRRASPV